MKTREQFNQENYQQAVRFAEYFTPDLKAEYLAEAEERYRFEQENTRSQLQISAQKRPLVLVGVLVAILLITALLYWQTERYQIVQTGEQMHQAFQVQSALEDKEQKNYRYVTSLQERLREDPNNGDLWYELGQAYSLNNEFDSALICYENAQKVLGKKASILGAMATASYYANNKQLSEKANQWIEQALQLDTKESASLLLLASDAYAKKNYQQAINFWRKVLDGDNESIDRKALIQSIQMAKEKLE